MRYLTLLLLTTVASCTDTDRASMRALGKPWHIQCYSGGKLIYDGKSTGKMSTVKNSDGWEFNEGV